MKNQQLKIILFIAFIATSIIYSDAKTLASQEMKALEEQLTNAIKERDQAARNKNTDKFMQAQKNVLIIKRKLS